MGDVVPVGYRFLPTDEELLVHYLGTKIAGRPVPSRAVADADVYGTEPWVLLGGDREAYFLATRKRKNATGSRVDHSAGSGSWTLYGKEEIVTSIVAGREMVMGRKSSLSFSNGRRKNSGWTMHEYELVSASDEFQTQVLCHISCTGKARNQPLGLPTKRKRGALPNPAPKRACPETAAVTISHQEPIFSHPASSSLNTKTDDVSDWIDSADQVFLLPVGSPRAWNTAPKTAAMTIGHQEPIFSHPASTSLSAETHNVSNWIDSNDQVFLLPVGSPRAWNPAPKRACPETAAMTIGDQEPIFSPTASSNLSTETDDISNSIDSADQLFLLPVGSPRAWKPAVSPSLPAEIMAMKVCLETTIMEADRQESIFSPPTSISLNTETSGVDGAK